MITIIERSKHRGFTLVEMMISLVIGSLVLAGALSAVISLSQGSNSLINYVDMNIESRRTLEIFGRDVRGATEVTTMTETNLVITTTGPSHTEVEVEYLYTPAAGTLFRTSEGVSTILLNNIDELEIRYYNLSQGEATVPLEVKHIQLEAIMKKSSLKVDNTNHIISAQFMLRNKPVAN